MKHCSECGKKTKQKVIGKEPDGDVYECTKCGYRYVQIS